MFSIAQKSLVKKPLRFQDRKLNRATLFPMFNSVGKVESLLVVDHGAGKVYSLSWSKGLISKPWFGSVRVSRKIANLEELTVERAYSLTRLWHYDSDWVLSEAPYNNQKTTPALKATNCVAHWSELSALYFSRDLCKVDFLSEPQGEGVAIRSVKDKPLPLREELEPPPETLEVGEGRRMGGWRLRPIWQRPA